MALGELQSVAKNMCCFFHGIRRLKLWNFCFFTNTGNPSAPEPFPATVRWEGRKSIMAWSSY